LRVTPCRLPGLGTSIGRGFFQSGARLSPVSTIVEARGYRVYWAPGAMEVGGSVLPITNCRELIGGTNNVWQAKWSTISFARNSHIA